MRLGGSRGEAGSIRGGGCIEVDDTGVGLHSAGSRDHNLGFLNGWASLLDDFLECGLIESIIRSFPRLGLPRRETRRVSSFNFWGGNGDCSSGSSINLNTESFVTKVETQR